MKKVGFIFLCIITLCAPLVTIGILGATQFGAQFSLTLSFSNLSICGINTTSYNLELEPINPNCQTRTYNFSVNNGTAQTFYPSAINYTLSLSKTDNIPLNVVLKDSENNILVRLTPSTLTGTTEQTYTMQASLFSSHNYSLNISWANGDANKDSSYAGLVDIIQITAVYEKAE